MIEIERIGKKREIKELQLSKRTEEWQMEGRGCQGTGVE